MKTLIWIDPLTRSLVFVILAAKTQNLLNFHKYCMKYARIRVYENPYSRIFYAVKIILYLLNLKTIYDVRITRGNKNLLNFFFNSNFKQKSWKVSKIREVDARYLWFAWLLFFCIVSVIATFDTVSSNLW